MITSIVYQAYGKKEVLIQTVFSILSLLQNSPKADFRVVIYTDQIDYLKKFFSSDAPIHYELLTPEQMTVWKGPHNFHHRMKIEILKDCAKKYDGKILYLDGDTYYTKSIQRTLDKITETQSVMHIAEHQLNKTKDMLAKKIYKFLKKTPISLNGKPVTLPNNFMLWNAGVIGLHPKHHHIFQDIIDYTDELYGRYPKHIMEQYAVSYYLQQVTTLSACDDTIEHYWNQKDAFEETLVNFFTVNDCHETFSKNQNQLNLPSRYYGKPRYTFKQKMKHKFNRLKYRLGLPA